jgi:putative membrane protein
MRNYWAYIIFGFLAVILVLTYGYESGYRAAPYRYWGGMMHHSGVGMMHGPMMGGYGFGGFGLLFWILVVVFVVLILKWGKSEERIKETPIDILNKRFARGEITKEEYLRIKEDILK